MSWLRSTVVVTLAFSLPVWLGASTPARADHTAGHECSGNAGVGGGSGEAGGECQELPAGGGEGSEVECDPDSAEVAYYGEPPEDKQEDYFYLILRNPPPEGMTWAAEYNCAGVYLGGPTLIPDPDWPEVEGVRDEARTRLTPPLPVPNVSPGEAVVKLPTWLWVDDVTWQPVSASASQGAVSVRVEARPVSVTWELVEGTKVCTGPGIPWSEEAAAAYETQPADSRGQGNPACTFTFQHSSTVAPDGVYHASVTVTWEFAWWLNGDARGVFGTVDRSSTFDLRVGEVQALITE